MQQLRRCGCLFAFGLLPPWSVQVLAEEGFDRTRRTPLATGMRFLYLSVSLVGQKNELGEVGNEKPSFDAVLNRVYLCQKLLKSDNQC